MAEAQLLVSQDEFTCSVCLDILSDPVSLHCGHSFCLKCLTDSWDQSQECSCPQCRHTFTTRPELHTNTVLNEVIKKLKKKALSPPPPSQNDASPGDVECDFCTGRKFRAVKSCLTCMASFCQTHLQLHFVGATWKDHQLSDPDWNLKEKHCAQHQKTLEIFCKTDETCICVKCVVTGHKTHEMVELEMEREEKQEQLGETLSEIQKRLEEREKTLMETRRAVEQMKMSAEREIEENLKSFTALIHSIEETHRKMSEKIREQEKTEIEKAEGVMERLEKEIKELKRRDTELRELSETKDHVHFLQNFSSLCALPANEDSQSFTVTADFSFKDLRKKMSCLKKHLEKISQGGIVAFIPPGSEAPIFLLRSLEPQTREEFLQYFCPLTLDPSTNNGHICLSEGNRKGTHDKTETCFPNDSGRPEHLTKILCREALTGTRCYWEVDWSGREIVLGVAYKRLTKTFFHCFVRQYNTPEISSRMGVYLDRPAHCLSFYRVTHTMDFLFCMHTSFTEPLYAGFSLACPSSITLRHLRSCDK